MAPDSTDVSLHQRVYSHVGTRATSLQRSISTDDLLRHGGIMAMATVAGGGLNYVYQVFVGRALGPEQFGIFGSLFALFYLSSVLGRGIRFSASRFIAEYDPTDPGLSRFYHGLLARSVVFSALVFLALVLLTPFIGPFLGVDSTWPILLVAIAVPASLAFTANKGTLQGLQWFAPLGGYQVLLASIKLTVAVLLVSLGYGVAGALGAVVIATVLALGASTIHLHWRLPTGRSVTPMHDYAPTYRYALPAVLAGFCLTVPGTIDVIAAQRFFPGQGAGFYTAVSVLGKILIFLPLGICAALFPKVSNGHTTAERVDLDWLLWRALGYAGVIAGAGALLYALVPELVLSLFFGPAYTDAAVLLQWYGVAIFAFVLAFVILNFELARDRTRFVYVFTIASIVEIGLLWTVHGSLIGMAQIILVVNSLLFAYGLYEVRK